jgi:transcriptional regulator with XRE-family HTH domain
VLLKQLRIQARLTHEELAEKASVAVRTISDLERGISLTPRKETVQGLADALELTGTARDEFKAAAREHRVLPAGSAATRALPRDLASFTGRKPELQWLLDAAAGGADAGGAVGIYAIAGMAGVGKTALALRAAHQIAGQFPDGQLYLDLRAYTDGLDALSAQQALASLLRSLGTPDQLIPEEWRSARRSIAAASPEPGR